MYQNGAIWLQIIGIGDISRNKIIPDVLMQDSHLYLISIDFKHNKTRNCFIKEVNMVNLDFMLIFITNNLSVSIGL